jgi:hypothetical protein
MRHLWLAIKEGLIEHRRALLRVLAVAVAIVVVVQAVSYVASTRTAVCGSCHIMGPYIAIHEQSSHAGVACVECHTEWRFVLSTAYLRYAVGLYTPQMRAEVPDARCLACHAHKDLDTDQQFLEGIHFSHKNHLGEMRRGKSLHCTSCHGSHAIMGEVGQSEAAKSDVQREVCFTCHFKGAEKGQAATGCLVCHGPPTTVVSHQGFQFDHGSYLKRDVRCDLCHTEVISGDANVPRAKCATCHVSRIEAYEDIERVHAIHLKQHQVDCQRCHNSLEHGMVAMAPALGERCENCHRPQHTPQEQMYIGVGGQGVADMPSTMFLARVACDSCHGEPGGDPRKGAEQLRRSCVACHGQGFDRMVDDWINEIGALTTTVTATVQRAEARLRGRVSRAEDEALVARARHNLDFLRRARGEHNIRYAVELLRKANDDAVEVLSTPGLAAAPRPTILASASGYCRVCHSTSHLGTRIAFAGRTYDHNRHLAAGLACETCHSLEEHGKTTITGEQCMACHHGAGQTRPCQGCHEAQASLYKGALAGTDVTGDADVMAQAEVECTGCHDLAAKEPLVRVVQQACVACHEKGYDEMVVEWINEDQQRSQELAVALSRAQGSPLAAAHGGELAAAERISAALLAAKGAHNTGLASDAYGRAAKLLEWAK